MSSNVSNITRTAWSAASSAWSTFLSEASALGSTEEAYAKNLIANATAQWTNDTDTNYEYCLERCVATYEKCVSVYGQNPFMDSVRPVGESRDIKIDLISVDTTNIVPILAVISLISVTAIGVYFFNKRRKED